MGFDTDKLWTWEDVIRGDSRVMRVPNGWVLNVYTTIILGGKEARASDSLVFIPDPRVRAERREERKNDDAPF